MQRAKVQFEVVVPLTLLIIFTLLYLNFGRVTETLIVFLFLPFALIGGLRLRYWLGFSVSVAAQTDVVMLVYRDRAYQAAVRATGRRALTPADLRAAIMARLLPIMWSHGTGSEIKRPIAVPMLGGMVTSTILTTVAIPTVFGSSRR